jgi:hypothetical protein
MREGEMKKSRRGCWLGAGAVALALVCAAAVGVVYWQSRATAFASRPLVLIHSPLNHERINGEQLSMPPRARSAVAPWSFG